MTWGKSLNIIELQLLICVSLMGSCQDKRTVHVSPMTVNSQMQVAAGSVVWVRFGKDELEGRGEAGGMDFKDFLHALELGSHRYS